MDKLSRRAPLIEKNDLSVFRFAVKPMIELVRLPVPPPPTINMDKIRAMIDANTA